jgi:hypothetical protein
LEKLKISNACLESNQNSLDVQSIAWSLYQLHYPAAVQSLNTNVDILQETFQVTGIRYFIKKMKFHWQKTLQMFRKCSQLISYYKLNNPIGSHNSIIHTFTNTNIKDGFSSPIFQSLL